MLTDDQFNRIDTALPIIGKAEPQLIKEFKEKTYFARIPAGKDVFVEGDNAEAIALLLSGSVRVYKIGESGREITLYHFGHGESCILTANAILSQKSFPAIATVESDAEAVMIPADVFRDWIRRFDLWREFVFDLLSDRLSTIMAIVDEVVFQRLDKRVAAYLINNIKTNKSLTITHQQIASDLGSSREVISRILGDFSQRGLVESGRGVIEINDLEELKALADM
jgi:CRP/FNR family transcriptional regulator, anaerobic regulatory protein